ncbi:unnamed protein product [Prorocentrum cordatum]|uniref:Protein S-acyltransferase n=1 Tax=Prorocentrum cordatum TaxID=2364126 RepID=A0ABN9VXQ7_9DINO|nr:unnamed protein product [Polarella glacialis]|mmetsp:Transcript_81516/g.212645  ORF Transcript_81516/g.212645 Transcript_81516/m.212645 type:complete len:146 (-) Transcript_81516:357-794(-)
MEVADVDAAGVKTCAANPQNLATFPAESSNKTCCLRFWPYCCNPCFPCFLFALCIWLAGFIMIPFVVPEFFFSTAGMEDDACHWMRTVMFWLTFAAMLLCFFGHVIAEYSHMVDECHKKCGSDAVARLQALGTTRSSAPAACVCL